MSQPTTFLEMLRHLNRLGCLLLAVLALLYIDPIVTAVLSLTERLGLHIDPNAVAVLLALLLVVAISRMTFNFLVFWKGGNIPQ